jgi:hypothetical protein
LGGRWQQVRHEVDGEGQGHLPADVTPERLHKNEAERDDDNRVEARPNQARPGTWVHMPTGLRHSIQAKTPVVMLLLLLK